MNNDNVDEMLDQMIAAGILKDVSDETLANYTDEELQWHLTCALVDVMTDDLHTKLEGYHNTLSELSAPTPELMIEFLKDNLDTESQTRMFETYRFEEVAAEMSRRRAGVDDRI